MLSYTEALEFIHGLNRFGTKLGLQNITKLLEILGNPHTEMKIIHVAGTNGKGSTCSMIDSILRAKGYRVGLYTSPYLEVFNERMRVNGVNISDDDLAKLTQRVMEAVFYMRENNLGSPTEFEVVTAIGFLYFKEQAVDFLVLEVGMGGRLDATNVVMPQVSIITPISMDHEQYLGNTLSDIAYEKCGIIKPNIPVIAAPQDEEAMRVIEDVCKSRGCALRKVNGEGRIDGNNDSISYKFLHDNLKGLFFDLRTPRALYQGLNIELLGVHQIENAATAVGAVEALEQYGVSVGKAAVYEGLKNAKWPGRLEIICHDPTVLIDGAHNIAGIQTLKKALERHFSQKKKILVLGILEDKDYTHMIEQLVPMADIVISTVPDNPRALSSEKLVSTILEVFPNKVVIGDEENTIDEDRIRLYSRKEIEAAIDLANALANPEDMIIYAGSLYMIGTVRSLLK